MKSVTTVTGDGSLLLLTADAFLSRSSSTSLLKPPTAVVVEEDMVDMESGKGDTSWNVVVLPPRLLVFAESSLGVE